MKVRWAGRAALFVVLFAALDVTLVLLGAAPDQVRLLLMAALVFSAVLLLRDLLADDAPRWSDLSVHPTTVAGGDLRLAAFVRLVEGHFTAATPDTALRDRLATLCDERLARRHALTRQDPAAEELLGAEMLRALAGPPRRFSRSEVSRYLERIENL